ncbi:MAG: hypothetical protein M3R02_25175 [Chloroflexota bacterium]|nr:hypothetical protein [Chloroflexota bacterium]
MLAAATGEGSTIPHGTAAVVLEIIALPHGPAHARRHYHAPARRDAGVSIPNDHDNERPGPQTPEEAEFLAASCDLDEAGQTWLQWAIRAMVSGRLAPPEE